jgi:hypothetical protein
MDADGGEMTIETVGGGGGPAVVEPERVWLFPPPQLASNRQITRHASIEMNEHTESPGIKGRSKILPSNALLCDMKSPRRDRA